MSLFYGRARHMRISVALLAVACLGCGCANYKSPSIVVTGARVVDETGQAMQIGITVAANNPNDDPLKLLDFKYTVSIDNKQVYEGRRAALATLPATGASTIQLPAVIPMTALQGGARPVSGATVDFKIHGQLRYSTPGSFAQALFDIGVRRPETGFEGDGQVAITPR